MYLKQQNYVVRFYFKNRFLFKLADAINGVNYFDTKHFFLFVVGGFY